jgi:hypothetical protein
VKIRKKEQTGKNRMMSLFLFMLLEHQASAAARLS